MGEHQTLQDSHKAASVRNTFFFIKDSYKNLPFHMPQLVKSLPSKIPEKGTHFWQSLLPHSNPTPAPRHKSLPLFVTDYLQHKSTFAFIFREKKQQARK